MCQRVPVWARSAHSRAPRPSWPCIWVGAPCRKPPEQLPGCALHLKSLGAPALVVRMAFGLLPDREPSIPAWKRGCADSWTPGKMQGHCQSCGTAPQPLATPDNGLLSHQTRLTGRPPYATPEQMSLELGCPAIQPSEGHPRFFPSEPSGLPSSPD